MKNTWRLFLSILVSSVLAATVLALPQRTTNHTADQDASKDQGGAQFQSVSGKIALVQTNSFILETNAGTPQGEQFQQGRSHPKTMTFLIDENTAVDGKLKVGDNADVAYRQQNGNNVAVSVRVTPE